MKKSLFMATMLAMVLMLNNTVVATENNTLQNNSQTKVPITKTFPKLYDKDGNELKSFPKPGDEVYDKDGNKLPPPPKFCHHHPKPDLNLTDKQKEKADKIREESRKKIKPIRNEIHNLKNEIWEIKENDALNMEEQHEKIAPLMQKIEKLRNEADNIRQEDMKQFEKILTKEQKKTLEEFKKTHKPPKFHKE